MMFLATGCQTDVGAPVQSVFVDLMAGGGAGGDAAAIVTSSSRYMPEPPDLAPGDALGPSDPRDKAVVVYLTPSNHERRADTCDPAGDVWGWRTPDVLTGLSGKSITTRNGRTIDLLVYAFCTPSLYGSYDPETVEAAPKVLRRTRDAEARVDALTARGGRGGQILPCGGSAGGGAALLAAGRGHAGSGGVIAFAPAFAGKAGRGQAGVQALHERHSAFLAAARKIEALIVTFDGDPYTGPGDLDFLYGVPGVRLVPLSSDAIGGVSCGDHAPHGLYDAPCFEQTNRRLIEYFLQVRLDALGARSADASAF